MRAFALEREHRVDHVLDHARAGDLAVLGDVADQDHGRAGALGEADQRLRGAAHLRNGAGRRVHHVGPHGLDRVDDDEARGRALGQGCDDVFNRRLSGELDRSAGEAEPFRAQPDLRDRLFTRNIDRALLRARQRRRHLDQQRRLADAGVAAEQQHRSAHEAAAGDAVEFGDAGGEPRRVVGLAGRAARARSAGPCAARGRGRPGARRLPRRSCSTRRRRRTCPASGRNGRRNSGRRSYRCDGPRCAILNPAGFGCESIMSGMPCVGLTGGARRPTVSHQTSS